MCVRCAPSILCDTSLCDKSDCMAAPNHHHHCARGFYALALIECSLHTLKHTHTTRLLVQGYLSNLPVRSLTDDCLTPTPAGLAECVERVFCAVS